MPRNGSGTYTLPAGNPVVTGTIISSTTQNTTMSDVATALTNSIAKDGQTVPTANLPMGGFKHTGAADATATGQYLTYGQDGAVLGNTTIDGLLQLDQSSDIVAAATTDLGTATGNAVTVTHASGTLAITSFGGASLQSGTELTITWSVSGGSLSATYNATSLIVPSAANLAIADGDVWKIQKISDSQAYWRVINIEKASGGLLLINRRVITASESGTAYTPGATKALVRICGGGGGSGGADGQGAGTGISAGSGAGGAYAEKLFDITQTTYDVTIGAGGTAGTPSVNGGNGGTTTFTDSTNTLTATGGEGGDAVTATAGNSVGPSANGGTASGGDINLSGGNASGYGAYAGIVSITQSGAAPFFGGGKSPSVDRNGQAGTAGTNYGEGAGGASVYAVTTNYNGAAGFQGVCILEEYA